MPHAAARRPALVERVPERPGSSGRPGDWDGELWTALAALPGKQRAAVAYQCLAGLPYREIPATTGGSTDAAHRAASDGIKKLRATYVRAMSGRGET